MGLFAFRRAREKEAAKQVASTPVSKPKQKIKSKDGDNNSGNSRSRKRKLLPDSRNSR